MAAHMVRITIAAPTLRSIRPRPAQDVVVHIPDGLGGVARRRYTIRHFRPASGEIDLDVFLHEPSGPGSRWARSVRAGAEIELTGPRGRLEVRPASWHLLIGDEASLPAIASVGEAVGDTTTIALIEVGSEADQVPLATSEVHWLHRGSLPAGTTTLLARAITGLDTPAGTGRAYLLGERLAMASIRGDLERSHRLRSRDVFVKGYWTART